MTATREPMRDGDHYQFPPGDLNYIQAEIYCHGTEVCVTVMDHTQFHLDRANALGYSIPVDDDGWLTNRGEAEIMALVSERFPDASVDVDSGSVGDEPGYGISAHLGSDLTEDEAIEEAWPFVAYMMNVTDPGTFNAPYLFNEIRES